VGLQPPACLCRFCRQRVELWHLIYANR
jgi:hypothetical protein